MSRPEVAGRLARGVRDEYRRWAVRDLGGGPEDAVLLAGSGRSGTTWVEGVLDHQHTYRVMFEPFRPDRVPEVRDLPERVYLRPGDPRHVEVVGSVLSGRPRHNRWVNRENTVRLAHRRLVKEVRAHGWLGWLTAAFPRTPVVVVVRHPVAVAASQLRLGWGDRLADYLGQPDLVADHLRAPLPVLRDLASPWERSVGTWCVQTLLAFRTLDDNRAALVLYEDLLRAPDVEAHRLLARVGGTVDQTRLAEAVRRESRVGTTSGGGGGGVDRLAEALARVPASDRRRALEVVTACGLGGVYGDDPLPDTDEARRRWAEPALAGPGTDA